MKINKLIINNLRNHISSEFDFADNINLIYGNNGVGKTTILEAISICSISHSFVPASDAVITNKNAKEYSVTAMCTNDLAVPYKVSISCVPKLRKIITTGMGKKLFPKDIIGEIPTVILSPDFKNITNGSPEYRRRFLDTILSQSNKLYLEQLLKMRKCLKHRNAILQNAKTDFNIDYTYFGQLTEFYIDSCVDIILRRYEFVRDYSSYFINCYEIISNNKENVNISYSPNAISKIESAMQIKEELLKYSKKIQLAEIKRGTTLFGPQKDELNIMLNGKNAREFASQGQHKSLLIALKFAEFKYLMEKKSETPVILFDDIFSELDAFRILKVLELLSESSAQIFITTTDMNLIPADSNLKRKSICIK